MKSALATLTLITAAALLSPQLQAQSLYYDTNGATPGTATSSTQNFNDQVWTIDPLGASATTGYTQNSSVIFSAGANGTGAQNVTISGPEAVSGFTFNNGTVTLLGSGSPNLSIGSGGIVNNSPDGATTFDGSLGTVTATADQSWNNNSTQALNINSNITSSGSTITFAGTGSGSTTLSNSISGSVNLVQDSATSLLTLASNSNNFSGTISANAGTVVLDNFLTQNNTIDLNGGAVGFNNTAGFTPWNNNIVLGANGGTVYAGTPTSGIDLVYGGTVTGGAPLNVAGGDFIASSSTASSVSAVNVSNARLLMGQIGLFGNNAAVNVLSGILDFGITNANTTVNNVVTLSSGAALETRSRSTVLNDVVLPTTGTVTLGSDDVGYGSISINNNLAITAPLTINLNGANGGTPVVLNGVVSGAGPLTIQATGNGSSILYFNTNNTYSGPITLDGAVIGPGAGTTAAFGTSKITANGGQIQLNGGSFNNSIDVASGNLYFNSTSTAGAETVAGPIEIANGASANVTNGNGSVTFGDITFDAQTNGGRDFDVDSYGTGTIEFNGKMTTSPSAQYESHLFIGYFSQNENAHYLIGPNADFSGFNPNDLDGYGPIQLFAGNLDLENSSFVAGQQIALSTWDGQHYHAINVIGAQTIAANIYQSYVDQFTLSQATADTSTWTGQIAGDGGGMTLSTVAGGTLNINGDIAGNFSGINKTGAGTVSINTGTSYYLNDGSSVAMDIQQGSVVIHNGSNSSPFGNNRGTINIEAGANLGGTGFVQGALAQRVIAMDATSQVTAGDSGNSVGVLTLAGGLDTYKGTSSAPNTNQGLTMNFTLDSQDNSTYIDLGSGTLNIGGLITVNIATSDGALDPGVDYLLMTGTGSWIGSNVNVNNTTFVFNTPAGYAVDSYDFDTVGREFTVNFVATPEPSTYALLGLGALLLVGATTLRRRMS